MPDATFALLGHPASYEHLAAIESQVETPSVSQTLGVSALTKLFEMTPARAAKEDIILPLPDGSTLRGKMILCSFLPEQVNSPRGLAAAGKTVREACKLARELGAKVAGLGGFTSIVGGAQGESLAREFGLAVTSGNSLTAALALEQLYALLEKLGWALAERSVAIVGATGDIGRGCALALAPRVKRLTLIARNQSKLEALRAELALPVGAGLAPAQDQATGATARVAPTIQISANIRDAYDADLIITATSAGQPLLAEVSLCPGTIVCDIGYPDTITLSPEPRRDAIIFSGGMAEMPFALDLGAYLQLPSPRLMYGCFSEAMALAMAGCY
ncbi:MAG: 3-hydroxyacyl-CoA dehydrogenase NAD-binding domain-containing protein, partial [Chloroflexota bacterium]